MNAVYTALDDLPCESHKQDYIWKIPFTPESQFTTALIFFNQEVVFAWYNGRVYVDRIPNDFVINFETELGAKYQNFEYEYEPEPEHYEIPVDQLQATIDLQSPYSNLSKQAHWELQEEIRYQRIIDIKKQKLEEEMAKIEALYPRSQFCCRTDAEQLLVSTLRRIALDEASVDHDSFGIEQKPGFRTANEPKSFDEQRQQAFDRAMAQKTEQQRISELRLQAFDRAMAEG